MDSEVSSALGTAFSDVETSVTDGIVTALPYALAIGGLVIAITVIWKFFKRSAKG